MAAGDAADDEDADEEDGVDVLDDWRRADSGSGLSSIAGCCGCTCCDEDDGGGGESVGEAADDEDEECGLLRCSDGACCAWTDEIEYA